MSALGHWRTYQPARVMSALPPIADYSSVQVRRVGDSQILRFEETAISAGVAIGQHENTVAAIMNSARITRT